MAKTRFFLGGAIDSEGKRTGDEVRYDASDLTTHGVIVGMTGSGKTGLGMIYIEEALRNGIPALVLDPKGDMTNLLLTFPDLAPADFRPWVDETEAGRKGEDPDAVAEKTAALWKGGLESWGLSGKDIADLRERVGMTLYTPGSTAGIPLDVLGSLAAPSVASGDEMVLDEIEGLVSGLLALVGVDSDPLSGKEHILLSNLIERAWQDQDDLTLERLIASVHRPPFRKLGVFEIDTFFPEKDRLQLAMRLNALVASPSFTAWRSGPPLDPARLLWDEEGKPQAAILYLAHLSDDERQFVVTTVLSRLITWMRSQPGTGDLRALVYMDEVFGFVPPTAMPPAKKPILTMMKQARAFGIGMLLATQNPVDLDYKSMSNAGTWCIGRLQTERDKARILEALESATGATDISEMDALISSLDKRQFLLHNTRDARPTLFTTRWAMSYLRGPLTRDQVADLVGNDERREMRDGPQSPPVPADGTPVAPEVASGVSVAYADPGARWLEQVGARRGSKVLGAALAVRVGLTYDETKADVQHDDEWEAVAFPLAERFDVKNVIAVDHDDRDFLTEPSEGVSYQIPDAPLDKKSWFSSVTAAIRDHLRATLKLEVLRNTDLRLYGRVGEDRDAFAERCASAADDHADAEVAKLRDKYAARIDRARDAIDAAYLDVEEAELDVETRRREELVSGADTIIGVLTGRRSSRTMSQAARKRSLTRKAEQRVRSAEAKATEKVEDLEDLEAELSRKVSEIVDEWEAKAATIDEIEIGLEKTDIRVEPPVLVWIPIAGD